MKLKLAYPISPYLLVLFATGFLVLNRDSVVTHTTGFLVYLVFLVFALYFVFCRHSCRMGISAEGIMTLQYLIPWQKKINIDLKCCKFYDYGRGFYSFSLSHTQGHYNLLRYPYDQLILASDKEFQRDLKIIKVNLRMGHFRKLLDYFEASGNLQLESSKGVGGYFW
jgi:hypothetical protein